MTSWASHFLSGLVVLVSISLMYVKALFLSLQHYSWSYSVFMGHYALRCITTGKRITTASGWRHLYRWCCAYTKPVMSMTCCWSCLRRLLETLHVAFCISLINSYNLLDKSILSLVDTIFWWALSSYFQAIHTLTLVIRCVGKLGFVAV